MAPGQHTIQGVHLGYEPDGPRQENVYPGQDTTVSIKITTIRRKNRAATDQVDKGLNGLQQGIEGELPEGRRRVQAGFDARSELQPGGARSRPGLRRSFRRSQRRQILSPRHRDRSGLYRRARQLWRHVAGSRRSGRSGPAVERGGSEGEGQRDGLVPAGGGAGAEGSLRSIDPGGTGSDPDGSESRRRPLLAGGIAAHAEELERMRRANTIRT